MGIAFAYIDDSPAFSTLRTFSLLHLISYSFLSLASTALKGAQSAKESDVEPVLNMKLTNKDRQCFDIPISDFYEKMRF